MTIYDSPQWISDLDEIIDTLPELQELKGKKVLITGAGGLICSAAADILLRYNERMTPGSSRITILAAGRSYTRMAARFGSRLREYTAWQRQDCSGKTDNTGESGLFFVPYDASSGDNRLEETLAEGCDYILHGASNAYPARIVKEPVETMMANFTGLRELLEYARLHGTRRLLYVSSSEVYGRKEGMEPYREDEYGYIDLLNARNSYSVGKRAAETLCTSYAAEYGVESVIIRPGHIYGPTASPSDNRVSSAWAYAAARGEDIVMKSDGAQLRSYCYCLDCAAAMFKALLRGENACAYNVSNPSSIVTIREMAQLLTRAAGVRLIREEATAEEKKGFNPMSNSSLDSTRLQAIGWKGCFDAERGFAHTVKILQEMEAGK